MSSQVLLSDVYFLIFLRGKMTEQLYLYFSKPISYFLGLPFGVGGEDCHLAIISKSRVLLTCVCVCVNYVLI